MLAALALGGVLAGVVADRMLKHRGHPGLRTFARQWASNYPASFKVDPPVLRIEVDAPDLEQLEAVVENARARGVILPEGNDYVKARCESDAGAFKAELRIKGKLTDHVQGHKWSFRVIAKKSGGFLGMKRFSLQHPGTRNYLCDWLYHRISAGEGIVALRYGFCKVEFNGDDLGVYAYEEHFGPELLEHNGRLEGPILRYDPNLYWVHRLNDMAGRDLDEPYAGYRAAAVDAYGSDDVVKDPDQLRYFEQAVHLLDRFRRGELHAADVFDVDRMARRHAIIDLVGGHHSMDWSDVKFYYDPAAQRIEPVSYESFSAFPTRQLAGAYRYTGRAGAEDDLHDALFNDSVFFRVYVHHLERLSTKAWLDSTFAALAPDLDTAAAMLYREFPYKELDRSVYYRNQDAIRSLLALPKPCHAYLQHAGHDTLTLALVPVNSLPVQVDGLVLGNKTIAPHVHTVLPSMPRRGAADPVIVRFVLNGDTVDEKHLELACRVPGARTRLTVDVFPYALPGSEMSEGLVTQLPPNVRSFPFFAVKDSARRIVVRPGAWTVDRDIVIPEGYRVVNEGHFSLDLRNGALLISHSSMALRWNGEVPVLITSSDSSSRGVHLIDAAGTSTFDHVDFRHLMRYAYEQPFTGDVSLHRSDARFTGCSFSGTGATLLDASLGTVRLEECTFRGGSDQFEGHHVSATITGCAFSDAADDAVSLAGGTTLCENVVIATAHGIGLKATVLARITAREVRITGTTQALEGRDGAWIQMQGGAIENAGRLGEAKKSEMRYGPVRLVLSDVRIVAPEERFIVGEGSTVMLNGERAGTSEPGTRSR